MSDANFPAGPEPAFPDETPVATPVAMPVRTIQPRPLLVRVLSDHNPFYLLSAACMLASCLALTNSLSWTSIAPGRLLTLIATLNVYEFALLAIALYLITRRGLARDGRMLLLLQAFFLADFTFLNAEVVTADLRTGVLVNAVLFALAAVKIGVVLAVLKPSFTAFQYAFVLAQLAVVFAAPCAFRWLDGDGGVVNPRHFYAVWWVVGLLPVVYELLARLDRRGRDPVSVAPAAAAAPTAAYLVVPFVSLLTHVGMLHFVYETDFYGAHAAPVLLGLTFVLNRYSPTSLLPRKDLLVLRLLLPAAAVLVSANSPWRFPLDFDYPSLVLTPLNLAVAGAFLTYVYCFLLPHAALLLAAGALAAAAYAFGPSRRQVVEVVRDWWGAAAEAVRRVVPKTLADWGVVGLVASFAFLALGFWISLRKSRGASPPSAEPDPEMRLL
jgi:hypothetical protein